MMHRFSRVIFLNFYIIVFCAAFATHALLAQSLPSHILEDWATRTHDGGRWLADNSNYKSASEPYDAYGLHWAYGPGERFLKGRLYGVIDGKEAGTFWTFTEFWDPQSSKRRVVQIGTNGTVGQGTLALIAGDTTQELQTFTRLDGTSFTVGHKAWMSNGAQHTRSFDVAEGTWKQRRYYVWEPETTAASQHTNPKSEWNEEFRDLHFFIGEWRHMLNDSLSVSMHFTWGENNRIIYYRSTRPARPGEHAGSEAAGVITYHGVEDRLVFMNSYLDEDDYLMSQGYYVAREDGVIERHFTCHYKAGEGLPWSNGAVAPKGGKSIQFKQIWSPTGPNTFEGDFFWLKDGKWVHPIEKYDDPDFKEVWHRAG